MLPELAADLGVTLHQAALLASAYSFPYAAMQIVLGPVGDAIGNPGRSSCSFCER